jgi:hypothetical protein
MCSNQRAESGPCAVVDTPDARPASKAFSFVDYRSYLELEFLRA